MERLTSIIGTVLGDVRTSSGTIESDDGRAALERRVARENARDGRLNEADGYDCPRCLNKGYVVGTREYDGVWQDYQATCSCMRTRRSLMNIKRSGLEHVMNDYTFERFKTDTALRKRMHDVATLFIESGAAQGRWLAYLGASGAGKTMICSAVAIALMKDCKELTYMLWKDDARRIKKDNIDGHGDLIERYKSVEILYIDDLFKTGKVGTAYQMPTAADIGIAFEILNARAYRKLVTIISSESMIDELFNIDAAVAGRIKQMCGEHDEYLVNIPRGPGVNFRISN